MQTICKSCRKGIRQNQEMIINHNFSQNKFRRSVNDVKSKINLSQKFTRWTYLSDREKDLELFCKW